MSAIHIVPLTSENREEIRSQIQAEYDEEKCGICQQKGAEVFWFSPFSRVAHRVCVQKLEQFGIENKLNETIEKYSQNYPGGYNHIAHMDALKRVHERLRGRSIIQVLEEGQAGVALLKYLFNTAALFAVEAQFADDFS